MVAGLVGLQPSFLGGHHLDSVAGDVQDGKGEEAKASWFDGSLWAASQLG